jgi:hypothetical protein
MSPFWRTQQLTVTKREMGALSEDMVDGGLCVRRSVSSSRGADGAGDLEGGAEDQGEGPEEQDWLTGVLKMMQTLKPKLCARSARECKERRKGRESKEEKWGREANKLPTS